MRQLLLILLLLNIGYFVECQGQHIATDTSFLLKAVEINAPRRSFDQANHQISIDSTITTFQKQANLADVVAAQLPVFIKSYGSGSLATPSLRGTGAGHTAVLWNGFNLQSSMNGVVDFALIPTLIADEITLQLGNTAALYGSGAIGGAIHLDNKPTFEQGLQVANSQLYGSFGNYQQQYKLSGSKGKWQSGIQFFHQKAANDFEFINIAKAGHPQEKQQHAALKQWGFLQENYLQFKENQQLNIQLWYQNTVREIPPTMLTGLSEASQKDETFRATAAWKKASEQWTWAARTAYFKEQIIYTDPAANLIAHNQAQSVIVEAETKGQLNDFMLVNMGVNNTFHTARTDGYGRKVQQNSTAIFGALKMSNRQQNIESVLSVRQEIVQKEFSPFIPSLSFVYQPISALKIKAKGSRNYRLPTFNDLYWEPGGNPDLKAEDGWSEELGVDAFFKKNDATYLFNVTAFSSHITNWILWLPQNSIWTPKNVNKVWSRGLENSFTWTLKKGDWGMTSGVQYHFIQSTNRKSIHENDDSLNKQLIYVPQHQGTIQASVFLKKMTFNYSHTFTGKRYVTADNSTHLAAYHLGNISGAKTWEFPFLEMTASARINNLWNTNYQTIAWRAMPGRYFQLSINLKFKVINDSIK